MHETVLLMMRRTVAHYFHRNRSMFQFLMWNSQGQWQPSWKCNKYAYVAYQEMLLMLCLDFLTNHTLQKKCCTIMPLSCVSCPSITSVNHDKNYVDSEYYNKNVYRYR